MNNKSTLSKALLSDLILDVNNPRFAELYSGSNKEGELIEYLLFTEAAQDITAAIIQVGEFYPDEPLWVMKNGDKYLVKDGNRRCAAAKALQMPSRYQLDLDKYQIDKLPILIFEDEDYLNQRIREKHGSGLFRSWERIAKALQMHALHTTGSSVDSLKEFDSDPGQLIKLASFYYEAVKIGGENLKKLLRRGRGKSGGKTIIFERLFSLSKICGYSFKNKPSYQIDIYDEKQFSDYITAIVNYLRDNPDTKHQDVDKSADKEQFLDKLKSYGFNAKKVPATKTSTSKPTQIEKDNKKSSTTDPDTSSKRKSIKSRPIFYRKGVPAALNVLIDECYDLDQENFANAKTALTRVSLECTLKYVVNNTKFDGKKKMSESSFLRLAFFDKKGNKLKFTNFKELKNKFTELIKDTGSLNAFKSFDLEYPHQIIHNYDVRAVPSNAKALCDNLIPILEFLLQEEDDLIDSLDISKL